MVGLAVNSCGRQRIMVVGTNITTVQEVSSYCLESQAEVLPYYGTPSKEEVDLFKPQIWVICLPIPQNLQLPTNAHLILWEEPPAVLQAVSNRAELLTCLEQLSL
ncbi:hypothetical protein [Chroococcidiopsis sp. TS-821]|uniref:hypothetical protein n=1 Tax=Chroococcidiopsis sp. TS-821 TaxID=1378066 RepID=UPI0011B0007F|nr:hypothetical protein [Chroococcidiopsis sp. TS-821]